MQNERDENLALIVARPGHLRDGLYSLLTVNDKIGKIIQADNLGSALELTKSQTPAVVILDIQSLEKDTAAVIADIKEESTGCRCLALIEHSAQTEMARGAGADVVLVKGCMASEILEAVSRLLVH